MRTGAALVRASKVYATEDIGKTWRLFIVTVAVQVALATATILAPWWPLKLVASTIMGLVIVRLFIFYHDYMHGAIFRKSTAGKWCMYAVGLYTLAAPSVWKETHNYHHQNNAKLLGSAIGSYPLVTVGIWKAMKPKQRAMYAFVRHPLTILFGYFTAFFLGMCMFLAVSKRVEMALGFGIAVFAVQSLTVPLNHLIYVHLLLFVYWLGPDWGVYVTTQYICGPGLPIDERRELLLAGKRAGELREAGFVVEAESDLFANPDDSHELMVYNEAIYRNTDRFFFKARKAGE